LIISGLAPQLTTSFGLFKGHADQMGRVSLMPQGGLMNRFG